MMTASTPLIVTFVVYLVAMVLIGVAAWRSTKNFDDYILGGRKLGPGVTALSAGASDMSGWLLMGLPGALYLRGASEAWIALGLIGGAYLNWRFVAGPLRVYTERTGNALTLPDFFTHRFEDRSRLLRVISALVILVFFAVYCASGVVAGARLFESVFGLPYAQALWWGAAVTILYTLIGGFLAVSWTDVAQGTLMLFALLLTPVIVYMTTGGFESSIELIRSVDAARLSWTREGALGLVGIVSLLAWGLGYFGQPHILARFMAAGSVETIPAARRIGMAWMILCLAGSLTVGFLGIAYFQQHPEQAGPVVANSERVFITLVELLFNPWVAGVILSAIFFMRKVGKTLIVAEIPTPEPGALRYRVSGQLFFASAELFAAGFEHHGRPERVEIDMSDAHLWDLTGVAALDKVVFRYRRQGAVVEVTGLNAAASVLVDRLGRFEKNHLPSQAGAH